MQKDFPELGYSVVRVDADRYPETIFSFFVYRITGQVADGEDGGRFVWGGDRGPGPVDVSRIADASVYLHGEIKWDGCSNWHFDAQDHCMLHFCSRTAILNLGRLMAAIWDWAAEVLPSSR